MPARNEVFRSILEEVAWEYGAGAPADVWQLLERERRRVELERLAHSDLPALADPISECLATFLEVEFDLATPGLRGLGRMTDEVPRLVARHRGRLRNHPPRQRDLLKQHARNHILCGYLFARIRVEPGKPRPLLSEANELFQRWIPLIYSNHGAERIGMVLGADAEADQALWGRATERAINRMLQSLGIEPDERDQIILLHYFTAGILLALIELGRARPPVENQGESGAEASAPAELFDYGCPSVSKLYVAFNGSLMAWVTLFYIEQYLSVVMLPF
ncbi:hypothetical protein BH23PLA1_BH23PLA1_03480 [soil metagenome]